MASKLTSISISNPTIFHSTMSLPSIDLNYGNQNKDIEEMLDILLLSIGVSMTFEEFKSMSSDERKSFIRDLKIKMMIK